MSAKQIEVQIMGQSYILGCPEGGEARLQAAVQKVDVAMCLSLIHISEPTRRS